MDYYYKCIIISRLFVVKLKISTHNMAATVDLLPEWWTHHQCVAVAATAFYFAKSRQDSVLAGLTSHSGSA